MSNEALQYLNYLKKEYAAADYPLHKTWAFTPDGDAQRRVFGELRALGLIKEFNFGGAHVLTDAGLARIMQ